MSPSLKNAAKALKNAAKGKKKEKAAVQMIQPSANWLVLQKKFSKSTKVASNDKGPPKKKRKMEQGSTLVQKTSNLSTASVGLSEELVDNDMFTPGPSASASARSGPESVEQLRRMVLGKLTYTDEQKQPGKYLAIDCEMVGVGPNGSESSLARASLVNYHGAIVFDSFVRQRERVTDYRTFVSGVRESDMIHARPFAEVQKQVSDLMKDRILVGHAVNNDLKALLLSHPRPLLRDTQLCAGKARLLKTKFPSLRKLAAQELGVAIQAGEHSSVTDARATMALYRTHRVDWEQRFNKQFSAAVSAVAGANAKEKGVKRKASGVVADDGETDEDDRETNSISVKLLTSWKNGSNEVFPGGGRRKVSSGLSVVTKRLGSNSSKTKKSKGNLSSSISNNNGEDKWWKTL